MLRVQPALISMANNPLSFGRSGSGLPAIQNAPAADVLEICFGAKSDGPTATEKKFMRRAVEVSKQSKDPSSKVGVVITGVGRHSRTVLSEGYNHFPTGIDEGPAERWERPAKYDWIGHGETNAIGEAARKGAALDGARIYLNWFPCINCAKTVIASGIKELVAFTPDYEHERWGNDFKFVKKMLDEAGIQLRLFSEEQFMS